MRLSDSLQPAPSDVPVALREPTHLTTEDGPLLTISVHPQAHSALVVEVIGELDLVTGPQLADALHAVARLDYQVLVVDLSAVRFMGSAGLAALIEAHQHAGHHTSFRIVASNRMVSRPLQITGLDLLLNIYPSRADALT